MAVRVDVRDRDLLATRPASVGDQSVLRHLDPVLVIAALSLCVVGLLMVYSATHRSLEILHVSTTYYLKRQAAFLVVGIVAMAATAAFDYRRFCSSSCGPPWVPALLVRSAGSSWVPSSSARRCSPAWRWSSCSPRPSPA
jgi:cell division protein FtsW